MSSTRSERAFNAVQQELDGERAAVLGRTGRGLEAAVSATCARIGRLLDAATDDAARAVLLADYRVARATSEERAVAAARAAGGARAHRPIAG